MGNFFWYIFKLIRRFKFLSVSILLAFVAFLWFGVVHIKLEEDISQVLTKSKEVETVNKMMQNTDFSNKIVLIVSQADTTKTPQADSLIATAGKFVQSLHLQHADSLIGKINFGIDDDKVNQAYDVFYRNLPLFLEEEDYSILSRRTEKESISKTISGDFKVLMTPAGIGMRSYILKDPLHFTPLVLEKLKRLQISSSYKLNRNYIFSGDGYHLFFFIEPAYLSSETKNNSLLVNKIQLAKEKADSEDCTIDYYGAPVISVGNANQIKTDILVTVGLALILLIILISFLFRSVRIFILLFMPVLFGVTLSLGSLYWFHGSISAIALGVGSILMGITIDYTLVAFVNYRSTKSVKLLLASQAKALIICSLTTSISFLCICFVDSPALKEMGIFAAISVIGTVLFVLIVTTQFLESKTSPKVTKSITFLDKLVAIEFDKIRYIKWGIVVITIISAFESTKVVFNTDLNALNYLSPYLKKTEEKLQKISSEAFSSVFFVVSGKSVDESLNKFETYSDTISSLQKAGIIRSISTASTVLKSKEAQLRRIKRWNDYWTGQRIDDCLNNLKTAAQSNHIKPEAFSAFETLLHKKYDILSDSDEDIMINGFLNSFVKKKNGMVYLLSTLKVDLKDKKRLYSSIIKDDNAVLWDKQYFSVRLVDSLRHDFDGLVWISFLSVFVMLLLYYGRIELAFIAMLPLIIGWQWTLGLMGLFNVEFNIFNIIISALMFGLGVDFAVLILNALIENRKYGRDEIISSKLSVLLSALTTFAGIGVLIFAKHPALKSIAALSVIGIASILFLSFTVVPICYRFLYTNFGKERSAPVSIYNLFTSLFAFTQFLTGCATLTAIIPVLFILPVRMKTRKYIFHRLVQLYHRFIVVSIFGIRKKFINKENFNLSTPRIIMSNHQSHLDLSLLMMLHPKIIVLTNNWVWNNPFYGFIVKFLDFYPVSNGMDHAIPSLRKLVDDGYSILIFPEGHRTRDGKIGRFHNGVVYLSEKLGLDILPVLIHGANHCMDPNEFFIRNGQVTVKFFTPIPKETFEGSETYISRSKVLLSFLRDEFDKLNKITENPDYYYSRLIQSYIYKGPVLEWYSRIKVRLENNYNFFNDLIPTQGVICDIGCGYGFMAAMLKFVSPDREIIAMDYDDEKISMAKEAHRHVEGLRFETADISTVQLPKADVFILADVLHYLPEDIQTLCIENCIANLNPGGKIIIRDADTDFKKRTAGTKLTEFFSTRLLHFNKTAHDHLFFFSGRKIEDIATKNNFVLKKVDNSKLTSNMIYILCKNVRL